MNNIHFDDATHENLESPFIYNIIPVYHSGIDAFEHIHWHNAIEISYVIDGEIEYLCDMDNFVAKPTDIAVINPNRIHSCKATGKKGNICYLIVHNRFLQRYGVDLSGVTFSHLIQNDEHLKNLFVQIIDEIKNRPLCYKSIIHAKTLEIAVYIARKYSTDNTESIDISDHSKKLLLAKRAIAYIHSHYKSALKIEEIANELLVSKCHLCRVFKAVTGQTLTEYINSYRVIKARDLLKSGGYTATEVSALLNFSSPSYFYRVYKKHIGHSPSQDVAK